MVAYIDRALDRTASLGAEIIVFGSGPARKVPEGYPHAGPRRRITELLRYIDPLARQRSITIAIEPLRRRKCNIVNTAHEGLQLMRPSTGPAFAC